MGDLLHPLGESLRLRVQLRALFDQQQTGRRQCDAVAGTIEQQCIEPVFELAVEAALPSRSAARDRLPVARTASSSCRSSRLNMFERFA